MTTPTPPDTSEIPVSMTRREKVLAYLQQVTVGVLRLRRVQVALTTIVVTLLIMVFPHLESLRQQLLMLVAAILMVALGGYTVTDAYTNGIADPARLEELLEAVADELGVEMTETETEEMPYEL